MPPTLSISVWNELLGAEQAMEEGVLQPPVDLALISVHPQLLSDSLPPLLLGFLALGASLPLNMGLE